MGLLSPADLAERFGLKKYARSWRGDCPSCSYTRAFSLRAGKEGRASMYCSNGCSHDQLDDAAARIAGHEWEPQPRPDDSDAEAARQRKTEIARRMFNKAVPATGTLADRYLTSRALPGLAAAAALRFMDDVWHPEGGKHPALLACVQDAGGSIVACHRTYLDAATGGKASVEPPKASLGPIWHGAIRLDPMAAEIVIGEGIETAASAGRLMGLPAWAAISAGNLAQGLILPQGVRSIIIAADSDPVGQRAAWDAAARWRAEGRIARVATPDGGVDFNDLLQAQPAKDGTDG